MRVFENRVLRRISGPRRDEVRGEWRKLHTKDLNDLYSSRNIIRVIKSKIIRWAGHVACMREMRGLYRVLVVNLRERDHLEYPEVDGRILGKWDGEMTRLIWLRKGTGGDPFSML